MKTTAVVAFLAAMASTSFAHMIMKTPTPMGSPNNSPLASDGSDFPCKNTAANWNDRSKPNVIHVGETQTLSFTGSAVHGGGSCQVSITKDLNPTKNSKWMVIHSIEGNCPSSNAGNFPEDPNGSSASTFPFSIPDHPDIGTGDVILAWTWNNKVGNREFYMNCAYVQLQPATKKRYAPSKPVRRDTSPLPDLFVANLAGINTCRVTEMTDVVYPNPGLSVVKGTDGVNFKPPTGDCGAVAAGGDGGSSGTQPSSAAASVASAATSAAVASSSAVASSVASAPQSAATASVSPGNFATVGASSAASSGPAVATSTAIVSPVASTTAAAASSVVATSAASAPAASTSSAVASPQATGASSGTPSSSSGAQSGPCTNEGAWACAADGKSFQRCASGAWSAAIPVAAGTSCTPGISMTFAMVASGPNAKRDLKSHILRRRFEQFSKHT